MSPTRITSTLGAVALGALLVASTNTAGAAGASDHRQSPSVRTVVHDRFVAPTPHGFRPHSNLRMGLHCDSADMSM